MVTACKRPVYDSRRLRVWEPDLDEIRGAAPKQLKVKYSDDRGQPKVDLLDNIVKSGRPLPDDAEIHYFREPGKPNLVDPAYNQEVYNRRRLLFLEGPRRHDELPRVLPVTEAMGDVRLRLEARRILVENTVWEGDDVWTVPAKGVYPFQWLWDSGFIARGWSHFDWNRGCQELESVFKGQWENGFIPHIRFDRETASNFFPRSQWDSKKYSGLGYETTGITQTPNLADTAWRLYEKAREDGMEVEGRVFLEGVYGNLKRFHQCLKDQRDLDGNGLLVVVHPDENGMDDSPIWSAALSHLLAGGITNEARMMAVHKMRTEPDGLQDERPDVLFFAKNYALNIKLRAAGYDARNLGEDYPFRIYDVLFNTAWHQSNVALSKIAETLGKLDDAERFGRWAEQTRESMNNLLWDERDGMYYDVDAVTGKHIRVKTVGSFTPFYGKIPSPKRARRLLESMMNPENGFNTPYMIPSTSTKEASFKEDRFWRGPVWPFTNYLVITGLGDCGLHDAQQDMLEKTLDLAKKRGICENYTPSGFGRGAGNFAPMAAIVLELQEQRRKSLG